MKFVAPALFLAIALSCSVQASADARPDIQGAANLRFITDAMGAAPQKFAMPIVLYFNEDGCLAWSSVGFGEDWRADLATRQLDAGCAAPTLPATLERLEHDGVALQAAALSGPVAIWYGSEAMCADCTSKFASDLPDLMTRLPKGTRLIKLDWK